MSLTDALKSLAEAHGPKALRSAFHALQGQVKRARQASDKGLGPLAQTFGVAIGIWDQQKADGVSVEDRTRDLEQTLRAAWPQTRAWKYYCDECSDTGWSFRTCSATDPCGRPFRLPNQASDDYTGQGRCGPGHSYVRACYCAKGESRRRALLHQKPQAAPSDYVQAGRSKKGLTPVGRP